MSSRCLSTLRNIGKVPLSVFYKAKYRTIGDLSPSVIIPYDDVITDWNNTTHNDSMTEDVLVIPPPTLKEQMRYYRDNYAVIMEWNETTQSDEGDVIVIPPPTLEEKIRYYKNDN